MDRRYRTPALSLFILSGAAGLVYEACWSRQLGAVFGFTDQAMIAAVAAFFFGSALGAWFVSNRVASLANPLKGFAIAELVAGFWSLGVPSLFSKLHGSGIQVFFEGLSPNVAALAQFICAATVVLPTTVALGASLPLMAETLARQEDGAELVPWAYGLHLAGALSGLFGASFAGFLFLGIRATHQVGSAISVAVGAAALLLAAKGAPGVEPASAEKLPPIPGTAYAIAALSGFATLALQGLFFRVFSRTLQNSSYTFAAVLAVYLLSLAWGSARAGRMVRKLPPLRVVGASAIVGAVLIPASLLLFIAVTHFGQLDPGVGFLRYIGIVFVLATLVIFPSVVCLGTILPALWMHLEKIGLGFSVGRLTAVNTLAAGFGAFAVGFVLLPQLGLWGTAFVVALAAWAIAALVLGHIWENPTKKFAAVSAALVLVSAFGFGSPTTRLRPDEVVEATWETSYGLLEVVRAGENLMLRQDIHYVMGDTRSAQAEKNQGHLPLYLHPRPQRVAFLGLATGITAGSALAHEEVARVIAVELIPEVLEAAAHFETHNRYFLSDPRAQVVRADAMRYMQQINEGTFDVVVSDLFVPWQSRTGYLYTVEHFENVKRRLNSGGIFALWVSLREVGEQEFRLIADSLKSVFPEVSLWRDRAHPRKICLVGGLSPMALNGDELRDRMAKIEGEDEGESKAFIKRKHLEDAYLGLWPVTTGSRLNTLDHPRVEHWAPITERRPERREQKWLDSLEEHLFRTLPRSPPFT